MKIIKQLFANTYGTKRGDLIIDEKALRMTAGQIAAGAGLVDVEHDPRNPPVGRITAAEVIPLPDGHFSLEATFELFDDEDYKAPYPLKNILLRNDEPPKGAILEIDEHYVAKPGAFEEAEELAASLGIKVQTISKNAVEPVTWLTLALAAGLGSIASSFLSEFGKDAYKYIKKSLVKYFKRHRAANRDNLLIFKFYIHHAPYITTAMVILTDPTNADVSTFLDYGVPFLDRQLPVLFKNPESIIRYVFSFSKSEITLLYGIRKDGLPLFPKEELRKKLGPAA